MSKLRSTLGVGLYGGTFNRRKPPTDKYWPPDQINVFFHKAYMESEFQRNGLKIIKLIEEAEEYIKQPKFYSAEYYED